MKKLTILFIFLFSFLSYGATVKTIQSLPTGGAAGSYLTNNGSDVLSWFLPPVHYSAKISSTGSPSNMKPVSFITSCTMNGTNSATFNCGLVKTHPTKLNCGCGVSDATVSAGNFSCQYNDTLSTTSTLVFFTNANGSLLPRDISVWCDSNS